MNDINYKSNKVDIITESMAAMDYFIEQNNRMKQQQQVLIGLCGFLFLVCLW